MKRRLPALLAAVVLFVAGAWMLWGAQQGAQVHRDGVLVQGVVQHIYGDGANQTEEVWLQYPDDQGSPHWLKYRTSQRAREGEKQPVRYQKGRPEVAWLDAELQQGDVYGYVPIIFGLYLVGWGAWKAYQGLKP